MASVLQENAQLRTVAVDLNYCGDMVTKPELSTQAPAAVAMEAMNIQPHRVMIKDGSVSPSETSLDREGFILVHHASAIDDFEDVEQIKRVHFPEMRKLLLEITGADVVEFPYSTGGYRSSAPDSVKRPAPIPHIDFSEKGATETITRLLPEEMTKVKRWGVYQAAWRCLSPEAPVDTPLAVLDGRSVRPEDCVPLDTESAGHVGTYEFIMLHYNPEHRWTYFSDMKRDDVILFKAYDSDEAKNSPVAHTAFADPSFGSKAKPRSSFEIRAFVGWYS